MLKMGVMKDGQRTVYLMKDVMKDVMKDGQRTGDQLMVCRYCYVDALPFFSLRFV
jgi:hypothetical protein